MIQLQISNILVVISTQTQNEHLSKGFKRGIWQAFTTGTWHRDIPIIVAKDISN